eukprot:10744-Heterococcus_DN1.PRE.5
MPAQVILIVNVASACGYTHTNYKELQALYDKYNSQGFTVLAFPCNQFGQQEAGTPEQIQQFVTKRYSVTFPMFSKIDVNGQDEEPLFTYLKSAVDKSSIQWNFTKYLGAFVNGVPRRKYSHDTSPSSIEADIQAALQEAQAKQEL